ncbi:hypothetical protein IPP75_01785 [Candidatus Saccharibacteria bacterium]|nr:MAG: hypothetical protein IPP75_01785 [Candidatus Saccharibacteria bacterium]
MGIMDTLRQRIQPESDKSLALVHADAQFAVAPVGSLAVGEELVDVAPVNLPQIVRGLSTSFYEQEQYPVKNPFERVELQVGALSFVVGAVRNAADIRSQYFRTELFARDRKLPGQPTAEDARLPEDGIVTRGDELLIALGRYGSHNRSQEELFRGFHKGYEAAVKTEDSHSKLALQDMQSIVRQRTHLVQNPPKGRILGDFEKEMKEYDVDQTVESLLNRLHVAIPNAQNDAAKQREAMRKIIAATEGLSDELATVVLMRVMDFVRQYTSIVATTRLVAGGLRDRAQVVLDAPSGLFPHSPDPQPSTISGAVVGKPREVPSILNIVKDQG